MRVLGQVGVDRGRLNLVAGPGVRRVKVARGRSGYGFTMSGQGPCLLCGVVKGSPADNVGLRPGDYILSVNGTDVSQATHETVAQLIGTSSEPLCLVVNAGSSSRPVDSCWSEEELDLQGKEEGRSFKPAKSKQSTREPRQHGNAEANRWSVASFAASTQFIGQSSGSKQQNTQFKQRPVSEPDLSYWARQGHSKSNPALFSEEEPVKVLSDDSVLSEPVQHEDDPLPDSTILNMGMVVGYINSMALNLRSTDSEEDGLQAIRGCISQIGVEQSTHSLVMLKITCHGVQLCDDRGVTLTACPAENLALCAISHEDPRFFALLSLVGKPDVGEAVHLRTICHVFFIDPELYKHKAHQSIISHFDLECTPDPDTQGCLEFPPTPGSVLQFVSVLYRDMGDFIERLRLRLDREVTDEGQPNARHSGSADSGIGNVSPVGQGGRDLLPDRWDFPVPTVPNHVAHRSPPALMGQRQNASAFRAERRCLLSEPLPGPAVPPPADAPPPGRAPGTPSGPVRRNSQRWPSISIRAPWPRPRPHHPAPEAEARMPRSKSSTLPLDDAQGPRGAGAQEEFALPPATAQQHENIRRLFSGATKHKPGETKGSRFWAVGRGRSSVRRSLGRSKRLSLARSLDDLETAAASDDERAAIKLRESGSEASLDSNGSLPSAHTHRSLSERRVASWAVCFERLLQDPVGVRYFSEFLKKEFSEENILFWQACEVFSQVPENDQKQLSQQAKEIYTSFLSSKATTPVNIDSQAQLADNVLTAPKPDMFKQQQLQIFNLMKFDSYSRFLKSSLYQECMLAEVEGRPLPDPYLVPCSPAPSKHSFTSDRSTLSTPKKETRKPKPGTSSEDIRDERSDKKNGIFSWYRNRSFGKGPKKRELTDFNYASNGRRESQGSLSSSASQELNTTCSGGKSECDLRSASVLWERDREAWARPCTVALPDGSCCPMPLRQGATVRQLLLELCQKHHINMAAVDLFLVGGEKPLVLDQDSTTLSSRDLRLERRTLFRLDLVPINRSVGLKAKPTKPVTEVLRPVVAKYGLRLNDLVARISGEAEALDLGLPISNLDGLRVVLERADPSSPKGDKSMSILSKTHAPAPSSRSSSTLGDDRLSGSPGGGESRETLAPIDAPEKRKSKKNPLQEAEELFDLLSRAQSSRADDQRGLLRKEDLVLPDFLRLNSDPPACSTPTSNKPGHAVTTSTPPDSSASNGHPPCPTGHAPPPLAAPLSPILHHAGLRGVAEEEGLGDLTLVGEGDITSPNSTLLPLPPCPPDPLDGSLPVANFTPPPPYVPRHERPGTNKGVTACTPPAYQQRAPCLNSAPQRASPSAENSEMSRSFEGYVAELRQCQSRMQNGKTHTAHPTPPNSSHQEEEESGVRTYQATFV